MCHLLLLIKAAFDTDLVLLLLIHSLYGVLGYLEYGFEGLALKRSVFLSAGGFLKTPHFR